MPLPNAPLKGLQAAATPDEQIAQRIGVNQMMSGGGAPPPQTAPPRPTVAPGSIQLNPATPDPQGMLAALKQAGYTGQRTGDINLPDEPQSMDELTKRIDALMRR